jgi:hypothetical protein
MQLNCLVQEGGSSCYINLWETRELVKCKDSLVPDSMDVELSV